LNVTQGTYGTFANGVDGNVVVGDYDNEIGYYGFVTTVPEPESISLIGLTGLGLLARRRIAGPRIPHISAVS